MELSHRPESTTPLPSYPYYHMETPASIGGGNSEITVPGGELIENTYPAVETPAGTKDTPPQTDASREVGVPEEQREVSEQDTPFPEIWTIDNSAASALHQELSSVAPKVHARVAARLEQVIAHATKTYKDYLPDETIQRIPGLADRTIIMDDERFTNFFGAWYGDNGQASPTANGLYSSNGDIIAVRDLTDYWQQQQKMTAQLVSTPGVRDLAHAKQIMENIGYAETVTHEAYHHLQDPSLPTFFQENGAYYYQQTTAESLNFGRLDSDERAKITDFYKNLIDKYGDDVHKLFFGTLNNTERRTEILAEYTPQKITEIFPKQVSQKVLADLEDSSTAN